MSNERKFTLMRCTTCGTSKAWPDAFPRIVEATCWQCTWNEHIHREHPRVRRRILRDARKRARRNNERELLKYMTRDAAAQALGQAAAGKATEADPGPQDEEMCDERDRAGRAALRRADPSS